uniref:Uncharacterized protein n=1 Tax=Electrophorus electricus TaxID=8005 RepID=A0AAY5F386_ELEEL
FSLKEKNISGKNSFVVFLEGSPWIIFPFSLCRLCDCKITEEGCAALVSALSSNPSSHLRKLNLTKNKPGDSGVKQLSALLEDPHCKLEMLELSDCSITDEGCAALASAVRSNLSSHLRELNLTKNKPGDSGVKQLSALLEDPHWCLCVYVHSFFLSQKNVFLFS